MTDEELALDLLYRAGVLVHPGYFFDFATDDYLVVSLLPEPGIFAEGVRRLAERLACLEEKPRPGSATPEARSRIGP